MSTFKKSIQSEAYRLVFWQFIAILGLALVLFLLQGVHAAGSAFVGGLAYCVPNLVFVWRVFARASVRQVKQFMFAFFFGEAMKLFLSAALFTWMMIHFSISLGYALMGFVTAIVAFWVVSMIVLSHEVKGMQQ